jgi:hypothetical protein
VLVGDVLQPARLHHRIGDGGPGRFHVDDCGDVDTGRLDA